MFRQADAFQECSCHEEVTLVCRNIYLGGWYYHYIHMNLMILGLPI